MFTLRPLTGGDYICGNELSFQEVIMDLGRELDKQNTGREDRMKQKHWREKVSE